jgi:pyruvate kinase
VNRRAKIVCTSAPATSSYEAIRGLVYAGMDVARLNFSHGAYEQHAEAYRWVRQASDESGRGVGVLVDLQGPKIRLGTFASARCVGDGRDRHHHHRRRRGHARPGLHDLQGPGRDVSVGDRLLVDDGRVGLRVVGRRRPGRPPDGHRGRAGLQQQGPVAARASA